MMPPACARMLTLVMVSATAPSKLVVKESPIRLSLSEMHTALPLVVDLGQGQDLEVPPAPTPLSSLVHLRLPLLLRRLLLEVVVPELVDPHLIYHFRYLEC